VFAVKRHPIAALVARCDLRTGYIEKDREPTAPAIWTCEIHNFPPIENDGGGESYASFCRGGQATRCDFVQS
jgi:hypothetical protein